MSCPDNSCSCPENTAVCESLPSALDNFIRSFFGTVVKTEVDGEVAWTLPCNLDVGLTNNPRVADEGLACYFLRLFREGLVGLTGPAGADGAAGAPGRNGYTVTTSAFVVPTLAAPNTQFNIVPSATVYAGLSVFIPGAGWFDVNQVFQNSTVFATLVQLVPGALATIPAGTTVLPAGARGQSIKGDKGDKGNKGDKGDTGATGATGVGVAGPVGPTGATVTNANAQIIGGATDFSLTGGFTKVDFGATDLEVTLDAGTYLLSVSLGIRGDAAAGAPHQVSAYIYDVTHSQIIDGGQQNFTTGANNGGVPWYSNGSIHAIVTLTESTQFQVFAGDFGPGANLGTIEYATSKFIWVKLA